MASKMIQMLQQAGLKFRARPSNTRDPDAGDTDYPPPRQEPGWNANSQVIQQTQQPSVPQGWSDNWPSNSNVTFPSGYPPPMPSKGAESSHWNTGSWYIPHADVQNPQRPWDAAVLFPPNPRARKRLTKPPSPSYWNTKLSENGLGLEDMVQRKNPLEDGNESPWIWNPPGLRETNDRATPKRSFVRLPKPPSPSYWDTKLSDNGLGLEGMVKRGNTLENGDKTPWIWNPPGLRETNDRAIPKRDFNSHGNGSLAGPSTLSRHLIGQADRGLQWVHPHSRFPTPSRGSIIPEPMASSMQHASGSFTDDSPHSTLVIANLVMSHELLLSELPSGEIDLAPLHYPGSWDPIDSMRYPNGLRSSPHVSHTLNRSSGTQISGNVNTHPAPLIEPALDASRLPVQGLPPPRYRRIGFWNQRGDHLTPNGYVVYAPHDLAYPDELRDYPGAREGYLDQYGTVAAWREERPELPASLPYRGLPPSQPYESFVVYSYLP